MASKSNASTTGFVLHTLIEVPVSGYFFAPLIAEFSAAMSTSGMYGFCTKEANPLPVNRLVASCSL
jgi:hypothetical protein